MTDESGPWRKQAETLVTCNTLYEKTYWYDVKHVAAALAQAYEYGFAQGRLAEIEWERDLRARKGGGDG